MRRRSLLRAAAISSPIFLLTLGLSASMAHAQARHPAASGSVTLSAGQAAALSRDVTDKVIVVFKNQLTRLPDTPADSASRAADVGSLQQGVLSELTATHALDVRSISVVNAVAAKVTVWP